MKKISALFMSLILCLAMSVPTFAAERSVQSVLANGWGEITVQKEWNDINVGSKHTNCTIEVEVIGTSGAQYDGTLTNTTTGKVYTLRSVTSGGGKITTNLGTLSAGNYRLYLHAWGSPSASGVVWTLKSN